MATRPPGDARQGTIETLGLPPRAVGALTRAGITDVAALAALSGRELAAVPGLGVGLVAAIRRVVPEPATHLPPRAGAGRRDDGLDDGAEDGPDDSAGDGAEDGPAAPEIPSFASLRDPRRRTAFDLLLPDPPSSPEPSPEPAPEAPAVPAAVPPAVPGPTRAAASGPPPAEYADLVRWGLRLTRAAVTAPARAALWTVRRLLGA